jgi:glyoxylase-like metal-dependent hydrolase (beta-lactamase superfamily II)
MNMAQSNGRGVARRIEDDVWVIDTLYVGEPGVIASYLIEGAHGLALVDVGSAATVEHLLAGIAEAGHDPRDISQIVLTHVHLDHAGATGTLARLFPDARVYVHPLGARHLIDPARLLASAARIYGDDMQRLWGTTEPVPAERVVEVADGASIRVAGRDLVALHTPGHAVHHIAYYDAARAALFAGDVAGVRIEGMSYVRPPTPPPDLNLEDWSTSIARMRALDLDRLYLPHFGVATHVAAHLRELEQRLYAWGELVLAGMRAGKDTDALMADLVGVSEPELAAASGERGDEMRERYERATNYRMTVQGYERYWRRRGLERGA